jgi:excisionase family DNA binding protein
VCAVTDDRVPLFVRLPRQQAAALDRLVDSTGQRKQQLVSEFLADRLEVGRIDMKGTLESRSEDVLTLAEVAELLRLPLEAVKACAQEGGLPGRRIGDEWRFVRSAVLDWLAEGERARPSGGEAGFGRA